MITGKVSALMDYQTSANIDTLKLIADKITKVPDELKFNINPKVNIFLKRRLDEMNASKAQIDWSMAEALAFGSLLLEGVPIRMSGQDTRRGTFSQRHAVLIDVESEDEYLPLNNIKPNQAELKYMIVLSPSLEFWVLNTATV